jgi:hypothetical protein
MKVEIQNVRGTGATALASAVINRQVIEVWLPISEQWQGARDANARVWGKAVRWIGLAAWLPAIVLVGMGFAVKSTFGVILAFSGAGCFAVAIIGTIVGFAWPHIEVPMSSSQIRGLRHEPPYVWIPGAHPEFLRDLPVWQEPKRGLLATLFGN